MIFLPIQVLLNFIFTIRYYEDVLGACTNAINTVQLKTYNSANRLGSTWHPKRQRQAFAMSSTFSTFNSVAPIKCKSYVSNKIKKRFSKKTITPLVCIPIEIETILMQFRPQGHDVLFPHGEILGRVSIQIAALSYTLTL